MRLSEYIFWLFGTLMLIAILDRFSASFNHLAAVGAARWWDSFRDSWRLLTPPSVPIRFPPPRLLTKSLEKCSKMMRGRRNDSRLPIIRFLVLLTPYLTRETVNFPRSGSCVVYSQNLIFIMMNISCRLVKTSGFLKLRMSFSGNVRCMACWQIQGKKKILVSLWRDSHKGFSRDYLESGEGSLGLLKIG